MSTKPIDIADEALAAIRRARELFATIESPAIQADPAWAEAVQTVDRAERAATALTEYGRLRPERLAGRRARLWFSLFQTQADHTSTNLRRHDDDEAVGRRGRTSHPCRPAPRRRDAPRHPLADRDGPGAARG